MLWRDRTLSVGDISLPPWPVHVSRSPPACRFGLCDQRGSGGHGRRLRMASSLIVYVLFYFFNDRGLGCFNLHARRGGTLSGDCICIERGI